MTTAKPILPEKGKKNILITSALPYVNNVPHLGNIVGSVLSADVFSRFSKLRNRPTLFICGTDEYGTATETKALETGQTAQEICDEFHKKHTDVYDWFEIAFDYFGRTTTEQQTLIAQDIFTKLYNKGYLEEKTTTQPYCEKHESFLADRFVEGTCPRCQYDDARGDQCDKCGSLLDPFELIKPRCKIDGATPVPRDTTHIFLRLDKLQPAIEEWFCKSSKEGAWPQNGISITKSWLDMGLEGRSITRDLKWGTPIPLPGYENKVLYVWFDACIGYPSITANYTKDWELWWRNPENVELYQFMGKDNVPFHTVVFPGSQLGTGDKWTMLNHLSTTEYLNYENGKFSKSRGVGVFGDTVKETGIPPSVWRYYLLANRPETGDTQFEWTSFIAANNGELLANLGNFINRLVKFVNSKLDSTIPQFSVPSAEDRSGRLDPAPQSNDITSEAKPVAEQMPHETHEMFQFVEDANALLKDYLEDMEAVRLRTGLRKLMEIAARGNNFLGMRMNNKMLLAYPKTTKNMIGLALNLAYLLASLSSPFIPSTAASIAKQLNAPLMSIPDKWTPNALVPGHKIGKAVHLFTKIDDEKEAQWKNQYGGTQASRLAEEEAKAKKKAEKERDKERKKAKKEAAKAEEGAIPENTVLPLRGVVAEEQAPPPAAAP